MNKALLFLLVILQGCSDKSSEESPFFRQFKLITDGQWVSVVQINSKGIEFYVSDPTCDDSTWTRINDGTWNFNSLKEKGDSLLFLVNIRQDTLEGHVTLLGDSARVCLSAGLNDVVCFLLIPCSFDLTAAYNSQQMIEQAIRFHIEEDITSSERKIQIINSKLQLDSTELSVVRRIDEMRDTLLSSFNLVYSEVLCWHGVDSLLSYHTSSELLIGPKPAMPIDHPRSASRYQTLLESHLQTLDPKLVAVIYPNYRDNSLRAFDSSGMLVHWSTYKFYNVGLGQALINLNEAKLKVIQLKALEML